MWCCIRPVRFLKKLKAPPMGFDLNGSLISDHLKDHDAESDHSGGKMKDETAMNLQESSQRERQRLKQLNREKGLFGGRSAYPPQFLDQRVGHA